MPDFIPQAEWDKYKEIINRFHEDANKEIVIWKRLVSYVDYHGEDDGFVYQDINLEVLFQYNYFRAWPINKHSKSGTVDKESVLIWINKDYLNNLGYLNSDGYFDFKPDDDLFIHDGIQYKPDGDSYAAQAQNEPLFFFLVLKRDENHTGSPNHS